VSPETPSRSGGAPAEPGGSIHERRRGEIVATVPAWYSPLWHLAAPTAVSLGLMIGALCRLHAPRAVDLLTVPVTLLGAFGFEWRVHQLVLHHRAPGLGLLYERHELMHHVIYTHEDMTMRSRREWWLVLMPAYAVVLVALVNAPITALVAALAGGDAACLYLATSMAFFLSYEWLHLAYHLPRESFVGRNRVVARLREHHRRHHDPRLMKRWNFNVTIPVFDWLHRTVWSPDREAAADARRARRARRGATAAG
jgi:hypothetical protein